MSFENTTSTFSCIYSFSNDLGSMAALAPIKKAAIIGAGQMGLGIAYAFGLLVVLPD